MLNNRGRQSFLQFSLADLFWITALIATLVFECIYMGAGNFVWWIAFSIAVLAASIFFVSTVGQMRIRAFVGLVFLWLLSCVLFGGGPVGIRPFLLPLTMIFFLGMQWIAIKAWKLSSMRIQIMPRTIGRILILNFVLGSIVFVNLPNSELTQISKFRSIYPIQSLVERLAHEKPTFASARPEPLPVSIEGTMRRFEAATDVRPSRFQTSDELFQSVDDVGMGNTFWTMRDWRTRQLKKIHDSQFERFIRTEGFGISRGSFMIPIRDDLIQIDATKSIDFDEPVVPIRTDNYTLPRSRYDLSDNTRGLTINTNRRKELNEFHFWGVFDFVDPIGWGWIPEKQKVAGFIPHAFHLNQPDTHHGSQELRLKLLQLVTIDRFDEPRAFVLDHLPRMDEISGETVPTRELSEFEKQAIDRLRTNEDIVIDDSGDPVRMVGSIRALEDCLQCHTARRGELLGAFTYEFSRQ